MHGTLKAIKMFPGHRVGLIGKAVKVRSGCATVNGKHFGNNATFDCPVTALVEPTG